MDTWYHYYTFYIFGYNFSWFFMFLYKSRTILRLLGYKLNFGKYIYRKNTNIKEISICIVKIFFPFQVIWEFSVQLYCKTFVEDVGNFIPEARLLINVTFLNKGKGIFLLVSRRKR